MNDFASEAQTEYFTPCDGRPITSFSHRKVQNLRSCANNKRSNSAAHKLTCANLYRDCSSWVTTRVACNKKAQCEKFVSNSIISYSLVRAREKSIASLRAAKGVEKNIVAKKCLKKIEYAPDQIKLSFWLKNNSAPDADEKNFASADRNSAPDIHADEFFGNQKRPSQFETVPFGSITDEGANFDIILPNLIHKSKELNLAARPERLLKTDAQF